MTAQASPATAGYRPTPRLRLVASEPSATYVTDPVVVGFNSGLDGLLGRPLGELNEAAIAAEVSVLERARRRIEARIARGSDVLAERQARRAAEANPKDKRAKDRARRDVRDELARRNGWSPTQAKDNERRGKALNRSPELAEAADEGSINSATRPGWHGSWSCSPRTSGPRSNNGSVKRPRPRTP